MENATESTAVELPPEIDLSIEEASRMLDASAPGGEYNNVTQNRMMRNFLKNRNIQIQRLIDANHTVNDKALVVIAEAFARYVINTRIELGAKWEESDFAKLTLDAVEVTWYVGGIKMVFYRAARAKVGMQMKRENELFIPRLATMDRKEYDRYLAAIPALETRFVRGLKDKVKSVVVSFGDMLTSIHTKDATIIDTVPYGRNEHVLHPLKPQGINAILAEMHKRQLACAHRIPHMEHEGMFTPEQLEKLYPKKQ